MRALSLALRSLAREWRSGELGVLLLALTVAVGALTGVGFLVSRISTARATSPRSAQFNHSPALGFRRSSGLTKAGGRIAYITCSVLAEENGDQVRAFVGRNPDFSVEKPADMVNVLGERAYLFRRAALISEQGLLMTPHRTDTDGFFVSLLRRSA